MIQTKMLFANVSEYNFSIRTKYMNNIVKSAMKYNQFLVGELNKGQKDMNKSVWEV